MIGRRGKDDSRMLLCSCDALEWDCYDITGLKHDRSPCLRRATNPPHRHTIGQHIGGIGLHRHACPVLSNRHGPSDGYAGTSKTAGNPGSPRSRLPGHLSLPISALLSGSLFNTSIPACSNWHSLPCEMDREGSERLQRLDDVAAGGVELLLGLDGLDGRHVLRLIVHQLQPVLLRVALREDLVLFELHADGALQRSEE